MGHPVAPSAIVVAPEWNWGEDPESTGQSLNDSQGPSGSAGPATVSRRWTID